MATDLHPPGSPAVLAVPSYRRRTPTPLAKVLEWAWLWWPLLAAALAIIVTVSVERAAIWAQLDGYIRSLDFDSARALLIEAWLAGMLVAFIGSLLAGRPWGFLLLSGLFTLVGYVLPFSSQVVRDVPTIFGTPEVFHQGVLRGNEAVIVAVGVLFALPAAATGDLLHRGLAGTLRASLSLVRHRYLLSRSTGLIVGCLIVAAALIASALFAAGGIDPILRYGPDFGVYQAAATRGVSIAGGDSTPLVGQVLARSYYSQAMGETRHYYIYLPPGYNLPGSAHTRYPVLYLLHGDPGNPGDWLKLGAPALLNAGIARGLIPPMIAVLPDGNGLVTSATDWANRYNGQDPVESAFLELVQVVDHTYRTIPSREDRLIGGFSSGAFGAANLAARHPDLFGTAMSFSGFFTAHGPVFGNNQAYILANSPTYLVRADPAARKVDYILVVGRNDAYYAQTVAFEKELKSLGIVTSLVLVPGGHDAQAWSDGLQAGIKLMAKDPYFKAPPLLIPTGARVE